MKALSIRQPYAEMILRGIKTIEYRSRPTSRIGERFYIYAARTPGEASAFAKLGCKPGDLPTGVIVGTARISRCTDSRAAPAGYGPSRLNACATSCRRYEWRLQDVKRLAQLLTPTAHPQPTWFTPFGASPGIGNKALDNRSRNRVA